MKKLLYPVLILVMAIGLSAPLALPVSAAPCTEWVFVETLTIDSNTNQVPAGVPVDSSILEAGKLYRFEAVGTYYANDWITADAKYCTRQGAPSGNFDWQDACGSYEATYPHVTELKVNGAFQDWGAYNPAHIYNLEWTGTGASVSFAIYDLGKNNTGSLTVNIYEEVASYGFNGLLPPYSESKAYKIGSSIPLKWQYTGCGGTVVASGDANPEVLIWFLVPGDDATSIDPVNDPGASGLRYDSETMMWIFNWQTTGLTAGSYKIQIYEQTTDQYWGFLINIR